MFLTRFHAGSRNGPYCSVEIELGPACAEDLARACRRQYQELQRPCRHCLKPAKPLHKPRHIAIGHSGVVASCEPSPRRENALQMAAPERRVLAGPPAAPLAKSRTRSIRPRSRDAVSGSDCQIGLRTRRTSLVPIRRPLSQRLARRTAQRDTPLRPMLDVSPLAFHRGEELVGALSEGGLCFLLAFGNGSRPSATTSRHSLASFRALASLMLG